MNWLLHKTLFLAISGLFLLSIVPVSRAAEVDLTTAYGLALAKSESLQISVAEWRAAEARYRQALGAMWPEISAKGESRQVHDIDNDTRRAGVGVTWTVFEGFRTVREAEARQAEGLARSYDVKHARLMLYEDVADVFFQIRSFQDQREAVQEQIKALESQVAELERRIKLGRSKRSDLLTTLTQIAETRLTIEQLNQFYAATMELLAFLTGQPAASLQVVDQTPLPAIGEVDKYLMAAADRPDIKADEASVEAARFDMKAAQSDLLPKVTLDGNSYPWRKPRSESEWDLVLSFEMPLFDGGRRTARVAEREQQLQISELRLAELQRSSEGDVRMAYQSLFYALRQWSELQAAIGVSADTVTLLQKDYALGRVNNLDVLVSTIQFWRLRQREAALANQLRANMVHLHVAAGKVAP
jgi:outer membrane protein